LSIFPPFFEEKVKNKQGNSKKKIKIIIKYRLTEIKRNDKIIFRKE
jgi:hypothetical protein